MKKLLKILAVSVVMCFFAFGLTGCAMNTMKSVYDEDKMVTQPITTATKLSVLSDYKLSSVAGEFAVFTRDLNDDQVEYVLFNLETNSIAQARTFDAQSESGISLTNLNGKGFALVVESFDDAEKVASVSIYYGQNSTSAQVKEEEIILKENLDIVVVGDVMYREADGAIYATEYNGTDVEELDAVAGGYYYDHIDGYNNGNDVWLVYDENLELIAKIEAPSYATYSNLFVLENGNALLQYDYRADQYGDDYDYIDTTGKFCFKTVLFNAKNASQKEIKFDYAIKYVYNNQDIEFLAKNVDNIAILLEIKDKRVDDREDNVVIAKISNNGKVQKVYEKANETMVDAVIEPIGNGYYVGDDYSGKEVLLDKRLNVIGRYDAIEWANENAFLADDKIYDYEGNVLIDLEDQDYSYTEYNGSLVLTKETINDNVTVTEKFLYVEGYQMNLLATYTTDANVTDKSSLVQINRDLFYVISRTTGSTTYTVYNSLGAKLYEKTFTTGSNQDYFNNIRANATIIDGAVSYVLTFAYNTYSTETASWSIAYEYFVLN